MGHSLKSALAVMVVLAIFAPALIRLANALVPVVLVVGVVATVVRLVWFYTGRW